MRSSRVSSAFAAILAAATLFPAGAAETPWFVEMRSFDAVHSRREQISKALGNAMLPTVFVTFAQQKMVKMFGKMRSADRIRWAGFPDGKGSYDVVMTYPTIDKVAKMTLNHPGSEKISSDTVLLPADEGRFVPTYAVFSEDFAYCALAATQELARKALAAEYPEAGSDLFAISSGGACGAFDFEDGGFVFKARAVTPETAAKLKDVPFLGALAAGGKTVRVGFDDIKRLIVSLAKELAIAKGILKGE